MAGEVRALEILGAAADDILASLLELHVILVVVVVVRARVHLMEVGVALMARRRGQEEVIEIGLHLITIVVTYILAVARGDFVPARIKGAGNHR
jgi:hypothetical protein